MRLVVDNMELGYGAFGSQVYKLGIEDVLYEFGPDRWQRANTSDEGMRGDTIRTLGLNRKNLVQPAYTGTQWNRYNDPDAVNDPTSSVANDYVDARKNLAQVIELTWSDAFMSACLRDHIYLLYELNKPFWIAFDDEMSRDCVTLGSPLNDNKTFITPTYPVAMYRVGDLLGNNISEYCFFQVYTNGNYVDWGKHPYRFDPEIGLLVFETPLPTGTIVTASYLWRMFVQVKTFDLNPYVFGGTYYKGNVVVEQLRLPYQVDRFDNVYAQSPCRDYLGNLLEPNLDGSWTDSDELPAYVGCSVFTDGPYNGTEADLSNSCSEYTSTQAVKGFSIPSTHWIHGVEVTQLVLGADSGCPTTQVAKVQVKVMLNRGSSTYSPYSVKSDQPVQQVDHAPLNYIDGGSDISWGGRGDLWGKPVGSWSPAMVNTNGLLFEVDWSTTCLPQTSGNWAITYNPTGSSTAVDNEGTTSTNWNAASENTTSTYDGGPNAESIQAGQMQLVFTWQGSGDPPTFLDVNVTSTAIASSTGGNMAFLLTADNGQSDPAVSNGPLSVQSTGIHGYRLNVDNTGVATYTVSLSADAKCSTRVGDPGTGTQVYTEIGVTATIAACKLPLWAGFAAEVHHSPVCESLRNNYTAGTPSGSWNDSTDIGLGGGIAISSTGVATGSFALLMKTFGFTNLGANSRIVGIRVAGQYRKVGSGSPSGNLTIKAHIGNYNSGRAGKSLVYPTASGWTDFVLGSNGDMWDYQATYSETGVVYPIATGASFNSLFELELLGTNTSGVQWEFQNLIASVYYFDVGDGL